MSASFIRSIRAKSLVTDFLLTPVSFPHGDDARLFVARRVGDHHQPPGEQTQRDEPFFSIVEAVIHECDTRPGKHLLGVRKLQAVLGRSCCGSSLRPIRTSIFTVTRFVVTLKRTTNRGGVLARS